jgi:hypothetical protein
VDRELLDRRAAIERERDGRKGPAGLVDATIRASWERCTQLLDAGREQAPVDATDEIAERWASSPIRRAAPHLIEQLADAGRDAGLLAIVTDATGQVLWESAPRRLLRGAEGIGLVPGGHWHETAAGTNGIGMALVTGRPAAVFATEHWVTPVRDWVCYAAPVYAPDGSVAGVIDLSTTWERANPLALGTIGAFARLIEVELAVSRETTAATTGLDLRTLGRARATLDGVALMLSRRQIELLAVLTIVGAATLDELHALMYGDRPVSSSTLRAEISHTRAALGGRIASRPYRLTVPYRLDALDVLDHLRRGDLAAAVERYDGQLLPASDAPLLIERRYHLDVALRAALLLGGSTAQLLRYGRVHTSDVEVLERAVTVAAPFDPELPEAIAALAVATADLAT